MAAAVDDPGRAGPPGPVREPITDSDAKQIFRQTNYPEIILPVKNPETGKMLTSREDQGKLYQLCSPTCKAASYGVWQWSDGTQELLRDGGPELHVRFNGVRLGYLKTELTHANDGLLYFKGALRDKNLAAIREVEAFYKSQWAIIKPQVVAFEARRRSAAAPPRLTTAPAAQRLTAAPAAATSRLTEEELGAELAELLEEQKI